MVSDSNHECKYTDKWRKGEWKIENSNLKRDIFKIPICSICGIERPARRPRIPHFFERECKLRIDPPNHRPNSKTVAREVLTRVKKLSESELHPVKGLYGSLGKKRLTQSIIDEELEILMLAGYLRIRYNQSGPSNQIVGIKILDEVGLKEFIDPGLEAERNKEIQNVKKVLSKLNNPIADDVSSLINSNAVGSFSPELIRILSSIAQHFETGDVLAERVFSARYLGDSKVLNRNRGRIEQLLGPISDLRLREMSALTYLGGKGTIILDNCEICLEYLNPYCGLSRQTITDLREISFPQEGVLFIENLTVFEACCKDEVSELNDTLFIWTSGMPGRAVRRLVQLAVRRSAIIRVWADLDLSGIRIFRIIYNWSDNTAIPYRMESNELEGIELIPLKRKEEERIKADLNKHPGESLHLTLETILRKNGWLEQESQL